jgi:hypothetical protein
MSIFREKAFAQEIEDFSEILLKNRYLAITGISKVGVSGVIKLVYNKNKDLCSKSFLDDGFNVDFKEISLYLKKNLKSTVFLCIPDFSDRDELFRNNFQKLLKAYPNQTFSIIGIKISDYLQLKDFFNVSSKPITSLKILQSRSKKQLFELLNEYRDSRITAKAYPYIYELSGGHPGLMKRCINVYNQSGKITLLNLFNDNATLLNLEQLKLEFNMLSVENKQLFSITDETNRIKSKLLSEYLSHRGNRIDRDDILLKTALKAKDRILSFEQIDSLLKTNTSLWGRYKYIERFKKKISPKYKLTNIRGKGYKLEVQDDRRSK